MLRLCLLRHAKSSWSTPGQNDIERPLSSRGRSDAALIGQFMQAAALEPAHILCSAAQRTRETLALLLPALAGDCTIAIRHKIYTGDSEDYLTLIRAAPAGTLLLIGHNPAIEVLAGLLAWSGEREARAALADKYPTGALAIVSCDIAEWAALSPGAGYLERFVVPRALQTEGLDE